MLLFLLTNPVAVNTVLVLLMDFFVNATRAFSRLHDIKFSYMGEIYTRTNVLKS